MTSPVLREQLIRAMREISGPYYSWPTASPDDDEWVEEGDDYYAPGIGQVADAVLPVVLAAVEASRMTADAPESS